MSRKKINNTMEITPLMGLSMLTIFVMMPTIFLLSNSNKSTKQSYAAQPETEEAMMEPSPSATPIKY